MEGGGAPLDVGLAGGLDHVEGDHGVVVHNDGVVALDEAHAAHVGGEVEDVVAAVAHLLAVVKHAQVHEDELVAEHLLLHGAAPLSRLGCSARCVAGARCDRVRAVACTHAAVWRWLGVSRAGAAAGRERSSSSVEAPQPLGVIGSGRGVVACVWHMWNPACLKALCRSLSTEICSCEVRRMGLCWMCCLLSVYVLGMQAEA